MNIKVRWIGDQLAEVIIDEAGSTLNLGLLDEDERKALAQMFRESIEDLRLPVCVEESLA
jgi:hypothetical protein